MINVGKIVYERVRGFVDGRCYPLVAEQTTKFPFMVYQTETGRPETTKDGIYEWSHNVSLRIVSDRYDETCDIVDEVVPVLFEEDMNINIEVESISEDYIDDAFVKTLTISIQTA